MSDHGFDRQRWQNESIFFQMGNIGSEVGRTASAYRRQDQPAFEGALRRGLDLFDATIEGLAQDKSPRLKEVLRSREQFVRQFFGDSPGVDDGLERYFMQFAVAERLQR